MALFRKYKGNGKDMTKIEVARTAKSCIDHMCGCKMWEKYGLRSETESL